MLMLYINVRLVLQIYQSESKQLKLKLTVALVMANLLNLAETQGETYPLTSADLVAQH